MSTRVRFRTRPLIPLILALLLTTCFAAAVPPMAAYATTANNTQSIYDHSKSATQNDVTFTVQWDDAASKTTTFHVTATGGSGEYKARMDVPTYWDNGS